MSDNRKTGGSKGRSSGYDFEDLFIKKHGGTKPKKGLDIWGKRKTETKTDVYSLGKRFSIKNPKLTSTSVQIQVCSVNRFCKKFNITGDLRVAMDMFFGSDEELLNKETYKNNPSFFSQICENKWEIDPSQLCEEKELRRSRILYNNIPENKNLFCRWLTDNMESVLKFILKESFNDPQNKNCIADTMAWATIKNDTELVRAYDIDQIISASIESGKVSVRDSQSVIQIGPFTLQMKGSGKGAAYHNMQFNCSYNDLKNFLGHEGHLV